MNITLITVGKIMHIFVNFNAPIVYNRNIIFFYALVLEDLMQIKEKDIITEGAAYLPELMRKLNISNNRYISITPTRDFQISHYKKREWISCLI